MVLLGLLFALGCVDPVDGAIDDTASDCEAGRFVGECAPDFTLPDHLGGEWTLAELRGQVVVLDFNAEWCVPCNQFAPEVAEKAPQWEEQGAVVLNVLVYDQQSNLPDVSDAQRWADKHSLPIPVLPDVDGSVRVAYRPLDGLPATFVIDQDGVVFSKHHGLPGASAVIEESLDALLGAD